MSGAPIIQTYEACSPGEKLHRLRVSYAHDRMTVEELEKYALEAWEEWDQYDRKGYNPDPRGFYTVPL